MYHVKIHIGPDPIGTVMLAPLTDEPREFKTKDEAHAVIAKIRKECSINVWFSIAEVPVNA